MILLIGSFTIGLVFAVLALGTLISFRVLDFRDLTVDGSLTLGGAVAAALLVKGFDPITATAGAFAAGMLAGAVTGVIHTWFKVNGLLAGILVMTALYSVNLHVMGKANVPLPAQAATLFSSARDKAEAFPEPILWMGWEIQRHDLHVLVVMLGTIAMTGIVMHAFFRTNLGLAMRAVGDNPQMIRALGVGIAPMTTLGLAISNGLVALSGALLVQYQGFADVQMGLGMVVWGFASVIIGETLVGTRQLGYLIVGAVLGSVLFRLLVAIALRWGLDPNDLKLITALFVLAALVLPDLLAKGRKALARTM